VHLELAKYNVKDIELGHSTRLRDRILSLNCQESKTHLLTDQRLKNIDISLARPGEAKRIIHILDVIQPRAKSTDGEAAFPGLTGPVKVAGVGRTLVLDGAVVVTTGTLPAAEEAIMDMSGPMASLSKFSTMHQIVLLPTPAEGVDSVAFGQAIMEAGFKAAEYAARAALGLRPDSFEVYDLSQTENEARKEPPLPKVAYIYYLYSHGFGRERLFYGKSTKETLPTLIHPNEVLDSAIVHNGYTMPSKSVTYNHQNNQIVKDLYKRHHKDLIFKGIIMVNHNAMYKDKEMSALMSAKLAKYLLKVDAAIISKDGGGQADVDIMLCCKRCESVGVKTVLLVKEEAGEDGSGFCLADIAEEADAIVTTGNGTERMKIAAHIEEVVGGDDLYDGTGAKSFEINIPTNTIVGAVDFQGGIRMATMPY